MENIKTMKILCFIKKSKLLKNGEAPIFIRISNEGEIGEFGIKMSTPLKYWDSKKEQVKPAFQKAGEINNQLNAIKKQIAVMADYYAMEKQPITPRMIVDKLNGKKEKRKTILKIFAEHNENTKQLTGIDFAPETVQRYETSYMHTKDFIR